MGRAIAGTGGRDYWQTRSWTQALVDYVTCTRCFLRHSLDAARQATQDKKVRRGIMFAVLREAVRILPHHPPPVLGREIHRLVRERTHNPDPYATVKRRYNNVAVALYPGLKKMVNEASDPFAAALRVAIAGNIIDFGTRSLEEEIEIEEALADTLARPLAVDHTEELRRKLASAKEILFLADNAGEIGFDRLLLEQLPLSRLTVVVRGSPVINDATLEDAREVGLMEIMDVIENGSDVPGTILEMCSPEFRERFNHADLVIAKGQGNYESLCSLDSGKDIFFLLKVKCAVVARALHCRTGDIVVFGKNGANW